VVIAPLQLYGVEAEYAGRRRSGDITDVKPAR
jgi:hypothetical protein